MTKFLDWLNRYSGIDDDTVPLKKLVANDSNLANMLVDCDFKAVCDYLSKKYGVNEEELFKRVHSDYYKREVDCSDICDVKIHKFVPTDNQILIKT